MAVSIIHRVTGSALSIAGLAALTWWLFAVAKGADNYEQFAAAARHPVGIVVLVGLTWAFFQHLFSGMRHLVMDTGANFDLRPNKTSAVLTLVASAILTAVVWFYLLGARS